MLSHHRFKTDLFHRPLDEVLVTDFFGGVQSVLLTESAYPLKLKPENKRRSLLEKKVPAPMMVDTIKDDRSPRLLPKSFSQLIPVNFLAGLLVFFTFATVSLQ